MTNTERAENGFGNDRFTSPADSNGSTGRQTRESDTGRRESDTGRRKSDTERKENDIEKKQDAERRENGTERKESEIERRENGIERRENDPGRRDTETERNPVSKYREAVPQILAVAAKNLLLITFGSTLGFPTILIPELQKENPDIPLTMEGLTWISSLNLFLVPIGCFASGPLSQLIGRKRTMMVTNIPFIAAWIIFHYATDSTALFIALALTGLTGGLLEAPVMTYVAEVTQPHLRGMLSATSTMSVILGVFTQMLGGKLANWRTVALVNVIYPVICFTALCLVPESPHWLAAKGRPEEAEKALCWLRGWVEPSAVRSEFEMIRESAEHPAGSTGEKESKWKGFTKKTFYVPFILVSLTFFLGAFGGAATLQTFAVVIFRDLKAPVEKYTAAVILGVAQFVGTFICVFLIHFSGKRILNFISVGGTGFCFVIAALYGYFTSVDMLDSENYTWLPTMLMIGASFLSHLGIKSLPWILAGEVFPTSVRSSATGLAGSVGYIFTSIANKTFLYMTTGMTLGGTFLFYAVINFLGGALLYYVLPETEGRTLREIEEHFAGVQKLQDKPKKKKLAIKEQWATTNPAMVHEDTESKL